MIRNLPFLPPFALRNPHVQTLLGSLPPRAQVVRARAVDLRMHERLLTLTTHDGVRLQALLSTRENPSTGERETKRPLVIVIHGWLGHAESTQVLSVATALWGSGFDVARLMLRDHGDSDHLNVEMFNSARMDEVVDAIVQLQELHDFGPVALVGFSLGGNFALRAGLAASRLHLPVSAAVAICPLMDPAESMAAIDTGSPIYRQYFSRKWHNALDRKRQAFPTEYDFSSSYSIRGVAALTDYFVTRHTRYATPRDYFRRYTLTGEFLKDLRLPTFILATRDDPVIPFGAFERVRAQPHLQIEAVDFGGHCALLETVSGFSFADRYAVRVLLAATGANKSMEVPWE